jgi:hypothetical protein
MQSQSLQLMVSSEAGLLNKNVNKYILAPNQQIIWFCDKGIALKAHYKTIIGAKTDLVFLYMIYTVFSGKLVMATGNGSFQKTSIPSLSETVFSPLPFPDGRNFLCGGVWIFSRTIQCCANKPASFE